MRVERVPRSHEAGGAAARTARDWTRAEVVRDPLLYMLLSGTLAPSFIATVIFFHQGYLIDLRGYDPLVFAAAFPVMAVTTIMFGLRSEEHTSELQSLMRISYAVFCLKKKKNTREKT